VNKNLYVGLKYFISSKSRAMMTKNMHEHILKGLTILKVLE
jgi:hypothetical protein